jgi:hypothetical protein
MVGFCQWGSTLRHSFRTNKKPSRRIRTLNERALRANISGAFLFLMPDPNLGVVWGLASGRFWRSARASLVVGSL